MIYTRKITESEYPSPIYRSLRYEFNDLDVINFVRGYDQARSRIKKCVKSHGFILLDGDGVFRHIDGRYFVLRKGDYVVKIVSSWRQMLCPDLEEDIWETVSAEKFKTNFIARQESEWRSIQDSWMPTVEKWTPKFRAERHH